MLQVRPVQFLELGVSILLISSGIALASRHGGQDPSIAARLAPGPQVAAPTIPSNGDVNPYGIAFVPDGFDPGGPLHPGDIIVSNFNNAANLQGTGTTIVKVNDGGQPTLFFQGQNGLGLTTALGALKHGFVLVGDLPSLDGSGVCNAESGPDQNVGQGGLLVIDRNGNLVTTLTDANLLNGPWDLTVKEAGDDALVFVANALSGSVTRLDLRVTGNDHQGPVLESATQIASGYAHRCDPAAFVVGPTGLALDEKTDTLYVSSTGDDAIFAIHNASSRTGDSGMGDAVVQDAVHLHGPLGLALAPNGDFISTQGDAVNPDSTQPSEIVEFNSQGQFVSEFSVNAAAGSAFGLALRRHGDELIFATVDDTAVTLDTWVLR